MLLQKEVVCIKLCCGSLRRKGQRVVKVFLGCPKQGSEREITKLWCGKNGQMLPGHEVLTWTQLPDRPGPTCVSTKPDCSPGSRMCLFHHLPGVWCSRGALLSASAVGHLRNHPRPAADTEQLPSELGTAELCRGGLWLGPLRGAAAAFGGLTSRWQKWPVVFAACGSWLLPRVCGHRPLPVLFAP